MERNEEALPDEMPQLLPWSRVFSIPEGTHVYLCGALFLDHGHGVFRRTGEHPLTVVFYDGDADTILRRSIWGARQRNEYWNRFTPSSLIAGTLALLFLAYYFVKSASAVAAVLALGLSMTPLLPFLPPGLPLYLAYRSFWKKARSNRAERDILRLPMRYFGNISEPSVQKAFLPDGGRYFMVVYDDQNEALESMIRKKVRTTSLLRLHADESRKYYVFGTHQSRERTVFPVEDPMAENLLIPGDPLQLAALCVNRARIREIIAVGLFCVCYTINLLGAFALFNAWIV